MSATQTSTAHCQAAGAPGIRIRIVDTSDGPARESYPRPSIPTLASGRTWQYAAAYELQGE
jgi:hypothetical protein